MHLLKESSFIHSFLIVVVAEVFVVFFVLSVPTKCIKRITCYAFYTTSFCKNVQRSGRQKNYSLFLLKHFRFVCGGGSMEGTTVARKTANNP